MKMGVVGAGLMGTQIGVEYALGGHDVTFLARDAARAGERITDTFAQVAALDLASDAEVAAARSRLTVVVTASELDPGTALVIESVVEDLPAKIAALAPIAELLPDATLASNTSSISITAIGEGIGAADRMLGTHYWNPPLLMPLVEVIATERTEPGRVDHVLTVLRELGKRPVLARRDVPGFIWNRMQLALLREAVWLAENGVASPADIDQVVRDGLARRWRYTGPFATAALGGADTFERIAANLWPEISSATRLTNLRQWLEASPATLAAMRERRDRGLRADLDADRAEAAPVGEAT